VHTRSAGERGCGVPWRLRCPSTCPCGSRGSPCGASAARTAARSCRWAFPQRRRPSGCRAWPAGGPMEIRFVSASEYELRHVVWQTRSARRTAIVGGRTWSWVRTTSSASVHGAPLASTGSAIHSKGVLSQRGRRRWVMKENTCVLDWRLFSTLHLPVWRITEELAHRNTRDTCSFLLSRIPDSSLPSRSYVPEKRAPSRTSPFLTQNSGTGCVRSRHDRWSCHRDPRKQGVEMVALALGYTRWSLVRLHARAASAHPQPPTW